MPGGPIPAGASVLPPNQGMGGAQMLAITPPVGSSFSLTVSAFGSAQVLFSPLSFGLDPFVITFVKNQDKECELKVLSVIFNHQGAQHFEESMELVVDGKAEYKQDRFHPEWADITDDQTKCPPLPLVKRDVSKDAIKDQPWACYSLKDIEGKGVSILARFRGTENEAFNVKASEIELKRLAYIKIEPEGDEQPYGTETFEKVYADATGSFNTDDKGCSIGLVPGDSYVKLNLADLRFPSRGIAFEEVTLKWTATCEGSSKVIQVGETKFFLLVVPNSPKEFWQPTAFDALQTPWIKTLQFVCAAAGRRKTSEKALGDLTRWIFHRFNFRYDVAGKLGENKRSKLWGTPMAAGGDREMPPSKLKKLSASASEKQNRYKDTGGLSASRLDSAANTAEWVKFRRDDEDVPGAWQLKRGAYLAANGVRPPVAQSHTVSNRGRLLRTEFFNLTELQAKVLDNLDPRKTPEGTITGRKRLVQCSDTAATLQVLGALLGFELGLATTVPTGYLAGGPTDASGTEALDLIGVGRCNNPVFETPGVDIGFAKFSFNRDRDEREVRVNQVFGGKDANPLRRFRGIEFLPFGRSAVLPLDSSYETADDKLRKIPYAAHMFVQEKPETGPTVFHDAMLRIGKAEYLLSMSESEYLGTLLHNEGEFADEVIVNGPRRVVTDKLKIPRFR